MALHSRDEVLSLSADDVLVAWLVADGVLVLWLEADGVLVPWLAEYDETVM